MERGWVVSRSQRMPSPFCVRIFCCVFFGSLAISPKIILFFEWTLLCITHRAYYSNGYPITLAYRAFKLFINIPHILFCAHSSCSLFCFAVDTRARSIQLLELPSACKNEHTKMFLNYVRNFPACLDCFFSFFSFFFLFFTWINPRFRWQSLEECTKKTHTQPNVYFRDSRDLDHVHTKY